MTWFRKVLHPFRPSGAGDVPADAGAQTEPPAAPPETEAPAASLYAQREGGEAPSPGGDDRRGPWVKAALWCVAGVVTAIVLSAIAIVALAPEPPSAQTLDRGASRSDSPVLAWTPGGLPPGLGGVARTVPAVQRVAEVLGDYAWLDAWGPPDGQQSVPRPGMRIPVDVAAVDVADFAAFAPPADREVLAGLGDDGVVLSRTGATLRGVGPGATLRFGTITLTVRGVVTDAALGGREAVVTRRAGTAIGVDRPRYLLVDLAQGEGTEALEASLRATLPAGQPLRVGVPGPSAIMREGEPSLTPAAIKQLFGEFAAAPGRAGALTLDPAWIDGNIQEQALPVVGVTKCHKAVWPQLQAAVQEMVDRGLSGVLRPGDFGGCWFPRFLNWDPELGISVHTWGLAVDFNVADNLYGTPGNMDPRVVEVMERWGFEWGGRWLVPDPMHFEFVRFVQPQG